MAKTLDTTPEELSRWLHGHRTPNLAKAVTIEKITRGDVPAWAWVA